jgi:peptidoglycan/LPS O-acetylase OafA/YrhL
MGFLRFLLAACVVGAHFMHPSYLPFIPGDLAVQFFFLLSGFYMALILSENRDYANVKFFYVARLARIYSPYFIFLPIGIMINIPRLLKLDWGSLSISSLGIVLFANLFIFGSDALLFLENSGNSFGLAFTQNFRNSIPELHTFLVIPQAWSLPLELLFYLLIPLIFHKKKTLLALIGISIASRVLTISLYGNLDPWTYRFFPNEILLFVTGRFTFDIYVYIREHGVMGRLKSIPVNIRYILVPLLCYFVFLIYQREYGVLPPAVSESSSAVGFRPVTLLVLAIIFVPLIFLLSRDLKWDRRLGELSYLIYLGHLCVIVLLEQIGIRATYFQVLLISFLLAVVLMPVCKKFEAKINRQLSKLFVRF